MPYRKTIFANNEIYHIVNRGVNHGMIFNDKRDYKRFILLIDYLRFEPSIRYSFFSEMPKDQKLEIMQSLIKQNNALVEIVAFCLMPNHFHLLLKQLRENGIQVFMKNLQNSYVKYFNTRNKRVGPLFQSAFKAVRVETEEQLNHVSRYINLNPSSSFLTTINALEKYQFSSLNDYLDKTTYAFVTPDAVLNNFQSRADYKKFVFDQAEYQRDLDIIKHLIL